MPRLSRSTRNSLLRNRGIVLEINRTYKQELPNWTSVSGIVPFSWVRHYEFATRAPPPEQGRDEK